MGFASATLFHLESGVRWTARVLALFLLGLVLVLLIGDGGFNPFKLSMIEAILMTFFLITCTGMVIAWLWPFIGGALSTAGILLFYTFDVVVSGRFVNNLYFDLMLLVGILFMLSVLIRRRMSAT